MKTIISNFSYFFISIVFLTLTNCSGTKGKSSDSETKQEGETSAIYKVTALTNHEYTFDGGDIKKTENPDISLKRGSTYVFDVETFGHPFMIKTKQTIGPKDLYEKGITNNATEFGKITFTIPKDAPNTLFYICKFHKMMTGKLIIAN